MPILALLCDSSEEVSRLRQEIRLADPGIIVEVATDGFQAVEAAGRLRPTVVVTEYADTGQSGGLTGEDLVRRLLLVAPETRVVVRTRLENPALAAEAIAAGAQAYILKGGGLREVVEAVLDPGAALISASLVGPLAQSMVDARSRLSAIETEITRIREETSANVSAKSEFLANVSHELRTPATVAKGIAYVLRNPSVSDEERADFLSQLQVSLDQLMGLIDEIITVSEIERGNFSLRKAEVDLGPLVAEAAQDATGRYPEIPIRATVANGLRVMGDAPRLGAVVRELLDNACRYSPAGGEVEVRARHAEEGILVAITDQGPGLQRSVARRAFDEPFSPGELTLRKEKAGVGVGLHLARQLVVEHGGILWTDPLPGGGTRVAFCLPPLGESSLSASPVDAA